MKKLMIALVAASMCAAGAAYAAQGNPADSDKAGRMGPGTAAGQQGATDPTPKGGMSSSPKGASSSSAGGASAKSGTGGSSATTGGMDEPKGKRGRRAARAERG